MNSDKLVITFPSTHYALKAEKVLEEAGLEIELIPVPRELSSSCGLAIPILEEEEAKAVEILRENQVETEGVHLWMGRK
ncbi:DUF3343 domain-containing protein [bacterium]|nr:DUF3343 domain-containing protein [bacterium]MBU1614417.1 DUF3343 domain-containing protein [bacterium]